jgi:hypothetical protein
MEASSSRFSELWTRFNEFLNEQQWYQELKDKWADVDPQSRQYIKFGAFGVATLTFLLTIFLFIWGVYSLKREVSEKNDLLLMIQSANEELRRLRESTPGAAPEAGQATAGWAAYFENVGGNFGLSKPALAISEEKAGKGSDTAKESLFDISITHVSIKQVVRYAFALESGARPVKLRNLTIDTKADPEGYLDAKLSVSAFTLNPTK